MTSSLILGKVSLLPQRLSQNKAAAMVPETDTIPTESEIIFISEKKTKTLFNYPLQDKKVPRGRWRPTISSSGESKESHSRRGSLQNLRMLMARMHFQAEFVDTEFTKVRMKTVRWASLAQRRADGAKTKSNSPSHQGTQQLRRY